MARSSPSQRWWITELERRYVVSEVAARVEAAVPVRDPVGVNPAADAPSGLIGQPIAVAARDLGATIPLLRLR